MNCSCSAVSVTVMVEINVNSGMPSSAANAGAGLECGDVSPLFFDATCHVVPKRGHVRALQITARAVRGGAGGRGSNGSRRRRWCRQKEIAALAIQRGRRKTSRWLCLGDVKMQVVNLQ